MKKFLDQFIVLSYIVVIVITGTSVNAQHQSELYKLDNPMSVKYLKTKLRKTQPRLVLNSSIENELRKKLKTDPIIQSIYKTLKFNSVKILERDIITVNIADNPNSQKNQLGISRDFLYRINVLAMVYRIEKDSKILNRINEEVLAACNFKTWNPKHFLDVGEMSLAIALALDWTAGDLPKKTIDLAKESLIEKGIKPSWPENGTTLRWVNGTNNWNQVCNGGMIAASIAVAETAPELAAKTIKRSLDGMNRALESYGPDGVYPEGAVYWGYGTQFSATTAAMLESAFGTDFGIFEFPGFKESAVFRLMSTAPSKLLFNYADCADKPERYTEFSLSWFASKTGNINYLDKKYFLQSPEEIGKISRLTGVGLVWTSQFEEKETLKTPKSWKGDGPNPIVIFTRGENDTRGYYFGGKGGRGMVNHGNMDAGSFIFELDGVRWVIDPGNQSYGALERAGFKLWERCQECDRWKILTKNNFGHSTISVNNKLHNVEGLATITDFKDGDFPEATIDMTPTFKGQLSGAKRKFIKDGNASIIIEDELILNDTTENISWGLITTAEVTPVNGGAILRQDGKELNLSIVTPSEMNISVISLDPPPSEFDKNIKNLKRIEINVPAYVYENGQGSIKVRLSGKE